MDRAILVEKDLLDNVAALRQLPGNVVLDHVILGDRTIAGALRLFVVKVGVIEHAKENTTWLTGVKKRLTVAQKYG